MKIPEGYKVLRPGQRIKRGDKVRVFDEWRITARAAGTVWNKPPYEYYVYIRKVKK